jgi:hypothetical protein
MSDPPTRMRPPSFSESHIYLPRLPRVESNQKPLISLEPLDLAVLSAIEDMSPRATPTAAAPTLSLNQEPPQQLTPPSVPSLSAPHPPWSIRAHIWAIRFALHLTLIGAFETVFFWLYVSKSEDQALTSLINNYVDGAITGCQNLTAPQHAQIHTFLTVLFNQTLINAAGNAAATNRAIYNGLLLRNSWLYFAAIALLFSTLAGTAKLRRIRVPWSHVIGENVVLVSLLGLYELMFFRTVVFQYRATTMEELDQMVVGELLGSC